ncbi:rab-interacting lysosomal protein isoform X1 [Dromaius novaehollandiae]|uniref:rab-interacting lysosomal protein isoform X1 n=1 Tax=Dromaius novaehollandiae TaxID=8790 RepID=UPI00311E1A54
MAEQERARGAEAARGAEPLWRTPPGRLAPPHVYRMAGALGSELRRLSGRFGPDAVAGLVPPVVRLLELLEALVAPAGAEAEAAPSGRQDAEELEQRLWAAERRARAQAERLARLEEQNRQLLGQLAESQSHEDSTARKEREVMLRLKEVVDKQRDEIRAQAHEIVCKSRDTEALQEQLNRFMSMNEDLRHKVAVVQAQLKSALEKKSDLEAVVLQTQRELSRRTRIASEAQPPKPSLGAAERGENSQLLPGRNEINYQKTEEKNQSQNAGNGGGAGEQRRGRGLLAHGSRHRLRGCSAARVQNQELLRAVVSGQQRRPPRAQLRRSLGNRRLAGNAPGAGGRAQAGGRLSGHSAAASLTRPDSRGRPAPASLPSLGSILAASQLCWRRSCCVGSRAPRPRSSAPSPSAGSSRPRRILPCPGLLRPRLFCFLPFPPFLPPILAT